MKSLFILTLLISFASIEVFASHNIKAKIRYKHQSSKKIKAQAKALVKQTLKEMPDSLFANIGGPVTIVFKNLNKKEISVPQINCSKTSTQQYILGKFNKVTRNIEIDWAVVKGHAQSSSLKKFRCKHKTWATTAKATLAHEIFHLHEYIKNKDIKKEDLYKNYKRSQFWHGRKKKHTKGTRVADPYEMTSIHEYLAVNFEYFLFDPQYKNRRPSQYKYFSQMFDVKPHRNIKKSATDHVYVSKLGNYYPAKIDPKRIYRVDYLLAAKGDTKASGHGHSMLRLVICAPETKSTFTGDIIPATPFGPECLKDTSHHLVVSFRANVEDIKISTVKGLTGQYASQLYILDFHDVIREYNKEFRDLYSYPMTFDREQIADLADKVKELYWEYRGSYKFISINCATETFDLVISIFSDDFYYRFDPITPYKVLKRLIDLNLISSSHLKNKKYVLKKQDYYPSNIKSYQKALLNVTDDKHDQDTTLALDQYLESQAQARKEKYLNQYTQMASQHISASKAEQLLKKQSSFLYLERLILERQKNDVRDKLLSKLERKDGDTYSKLNHAVSLIQTVPQDLFSSYGIPLQSEYKVLTKNTFSKFQEDMLKNSKTFRASMNELLKTTSEYQELVQIVSNINSSLINQKKIKELSN